MLSPWLRKNSVRPQHWRNVRQELCDMGDPRCRSREAALVCEVQFFPEPRDDQRDLIWIRVGLERREDVGHIRGQRAALEKVLRLVDVKLQLFDFGDVLRRSLSGPLLYACHPAAP